MMSSYCSHPGGEPPKSGATEDGVKLPVDKPANQKRRSPISITKVSPPINREEMEKKNKVCISMRVWWCVVESLKPIDEKYLRKSVRYLKLCETVIKLQSDQNLLASEKVWLILLYLLHNPRC